MNYGGDQPHSTTGPGHGPTPSAQTGFAHSERTGRRASPHPTTLQAYRQDFDAIAAPSRLTRARVCRRTRLGPPPGCAVVRIARSPRRFELRGQPAREAVIDAAGRLVRDSPLPELARAREILGEQRPPRG